MTTDDQSDPFEAFAAKGSGDLLQLVDAVEHRRPRLLIGASAKVPDVLSRALPVTSGRVYAALTRAAAAAAARRG